MVVLWLRFLDSTAGDTGSTPGRVGKLRSHMPRGTAGGEKRYLA